MNARQLAKDLCPPLLLRSARAILRRGAGATASRRPEWEYIPSGWSAESDDPRIKGWNVQGVLDAYKAKWDSFVRSVEGTTPFGSSPEAQADGSAADVIHHNSVMIFGYCLLRAAQGGETLSMLDWGGGIGHYFLMARALLPGIPIEYHCKDMQLLAIHGQSLFPQAHFCSDNSCLERRYDFVMASTSLQYARDWRTLLGRLGAAAGRGLLVTGLPVVFRAPSFVFVQRPYAYGYDTEYLGWCLNRKEFVVTSENFGLKLDREFVVGYQPSIAGAPEQCQYRGYFFRT